MMCRSIEIAPVATAWYTRDSRTETSSSLSAKSTVKNPVTFSATSTHSIYRHSAISECDVKSRIEMNGVWNLRVALALMFVCISFGTPFLWAQTLGTAPQFNVAVQGQTGAQPERRILQFH
jgi:hypothetical protein